MVRAVVVLSIALAAIQSPPQTERWFPAGEPELLTSDSDAALSRLWSWEEYAKTTAPLKGRPRMVILDERPALSKAATFGVNFSFAGRNRSFAIDGSESDGYRLFIDVDGNGKLTDDEMLRFQKVDGKHSTTFEHRIEETINGVAESYLVRIRAELGEAVPPDGTSRVPVLRLNRSSVRKGVAQLGTLRVPFALVGQSGIYDLPGAEVLFDSQRYAVSEGKVTLGGTGYQFRVDRYGRALALTPLASPAPERPSLEPGTAAPEFTYRDLDGREHRISDARGKVVLLVFWATWCGPCRAESPQIAGLLKQFGRDGLTIVGINPNDSLPDIQGFIKQYGVTWPTHREPLDGTVHRLFRINAWPTHILIGKDGRIVANRGSIAEMAALIAAAIKNSPHQP